MNLEDRRFGAPGFD